MIALPAPHPACLIAVGIPARDEAETIGATLEAFRLQVDAFGKPLDRATFEIVVLCNNCGDATAEVARGFARAHPMLAVHVREAYFPAPEAHVGNARRLVLGTLADRFIAARRPRGIVATTDADSVVDARWIAATLRELGAADAVAGEVRVDVIERARMIAPLRLAYDREVTYRRTIGAIASRFDPVSWDPGPRHDDFVGASFAVTAEVYRRAGGVPALPVLEDVAFADALERVDARIRHSPAVRVATSARRLARVAGGFSALLDRLAAHSPHAPVRVRGARAIVESARARHRLRDLREAPDGLAAGEFADEFGCPVPAVLEAMQGPSFGRAWHRLRPLLAAEHYPEEPVVTAIAGMLAALAPSSAPLPIRARAASGAG